MATEIAKTRFYTMAVDAIKNRIYFSIIGSWKSPTDVPKYLEDWKKTIKQARPGFTVLSDLTKMQTAMPEINKLHQQAQLLLVAGGLSRTAEVYTQEATVVLKLQVDSIAKASNMPKAIFTSRQVAEAWLDKT